MPEQPENSNGGRAGGNGHDPEGITGIAAATALAERTLSGDLRDFVITLIRRQRNLWPLLGEQQQTELVMTIDHEVEQIIGHAVRMIAGRDFTSIGVALEQVALKPKGVEAKLVFGALDARARHELADAQGGRIVIVMADPDVYRGARGLAAIDRDQPELPIGGEELAGAPFDRASGEVGGTEGPCRFDPDNGEIYPDDSDFAPPQNVGSLEPEPPELQGYRDGYSQGLDGVPFADLRCAFPDGSPQRARCEAGWYTAWLERIADPEDRARQTEAAADYFWQMGSAAAEAGAQPTDNPFPEWMRARGWWNSGFFAFSGVGERSQQPKRRRGKGASGEASAP